jgi:hypothetical protein
LQAFADGSTEGLKLPCFRNKNMESIPVEELIVTLNIFYNGRV